MALLSVREVTKAFGGLIAASAISFDMPEGELLAVIGPNGAGKTTLFNIISGYFAPTSGRVLLDGSDITGLAQYRIAALGLVRTYQLAQPFRDLSVGENVRVGFHLGTRGGPLSALLRPRWVRQQELKVDKEARELLEFVGLERHADEKAETLSYGQQRLLELARALAARPRLMLLDEPAAGLDKSETEALAGIVRGVNERGVSVLLIEHDMSFVMNLARDIVVLDFGRVIAKGAPAEVKAHPDVVAAYLGAEVADA